MENATKALLIAAAVLVAILIISLGLVVYNKATETVNNSGDLSEYEIQQFNEKFKKYEGSNLSSTVVNAMINTVFNHNLAQEDASTRVTVTGPDTMLLGDETATPAKVPAGVRYVIRATFDENSGLIRELDYRYMGN